MNPALTTIQNDVRAADLRERAERQRSTRLSRRSSRATAQEVRDGPACRARAGLRRALPRPRLLRARARLGRLARPDGAPRAPGHQAWVPARQPEQPQPTAPPACSSSSSERAGGRVALRAARPSQATPRKAFPPAVAASAAGVAAAASPPRGAAQVCARPAAARGSAAAAARRRHAPLRLSAAAGEAAARPSCRSAAPPARQAQDRRDVEGAAGRDRGADGDDLRRQRAAERVVEPPPDEPGGRAEDCGGQQHAREREDRLGALQAAVQLVCRTPSHWPAAIARLETTVPITRPATRRRACRARG